MGYACFGEFNAGGRTAYRQVDQKAIDGLKDYYDLHFLIASVDPAKLQQPILPFASAREVSF